MNVRQRSYLLFSIVGLISSLLLLNVGLIYWNSLTLERNMKYQEEAQLARLNTLDLIRNLHLLDLGLRGYALVDNPTILMAIDTANINKSRVIIRLEQILAAQNFPEMDRFYAIRDSVESYFLFIDEMQNLLESGQREEFLILLNQDRGYALWLVYKAFSTSVYNFEDEVVNEAKSNFSKALTFSYLLQITLFLITVPALTYMAFYTARTFRVSEELQQLQNEKNRILEQQNEELDRLVQEKTQDIILQSEKISLQNEEIKAHNVRLMLQQQEIESKQQIIQEQARMIHLKNEELENEVARQTLDLRQTNRQLVEHNNRVEQFANIISHNLRGPMARLKGLATLLERTDGTQEKEKIMAMLINSTLDMDMVIADLGQIINIQHQNTLQKSRVNLLYMLNRIIGLVRHDVEEVHGKIMLKVDPDHSIETLSPYMESVLFNLISNAIKYRSYERKLEIEIESVDEAKAFKIIVRDNGLGIDLKKQRQNLFTLYKRFHTHVEGKGLGLYLVKTQMDAMNGLIEVESEENKGSVFKLVFKKSIVYS